ncbi:MAG: phenylacetate--CoA ligase family protein [Acidobacteria bacterium]|nr:phenylacetate--CoA ligase family protein [Acidobacteriota bacterium]
MIRRSIYSHWRGVGWQELQKRQMNGIGRTTHKILSQRVLLPLTRTRSLVRKTLRPVMLAYYDSLRFRQQSANWSVDRKRQWILERLRFTLRRAYRETDFYRQRFDRVGFDPFADFSFADFAALPMLEKEELRAAGLSIRSKRLRADQLLKDATGGSTGMPVEIWLGPEERGWRESAGEWFQQLSGVPLGTRTALLWGHHLDPVKQDNWRDRYATFVNHQRWFDCFRLSPETLARYHREFEEWRPACIIAYAAALGALAEYVKESGVEPHYPDLGFVTGAEKLLPHHREIIETVFRRPVHERYGSRDVGFIGCQLEPQRTYDFTLDWANLLVEPEDHNTPSAILITKLHADAMPMIRYRIGDVGSFAPTSQPGHPSLLLQEVVGRDTDRIWLRGGRWITGLQMPHLLKDFAVREFQFVQRADYSIELSIIPHQGFNEESRQGILQALRPNLEELPVNIRLVDRIERTLASKWRPVISHVKPEEQQLT